jgi:isopenicillin-N N-acyltransferase-like protein
VVELKMSVSENMAIPFDFLDVSGSHREIGRQIGEGARLQIERCIAAYEGDFELQTGMSLSAAEEATLPLLAAAERVVPQYVEELRGLAEGAAVPFSSLLLLNCGEELYCPATPHRRHCTSLALAAEGQTIVAHNEDWAAQDIENNVLIRITTPDHIRILAMTTACFLPMTGLNSHGLAFAANTLYAEDQRPGVPNALVCRWALEAATREEAIARVLLPTRSRGSNHLFGRTGGVLWDVETSAQRAAVIEGTGWLVHTNHYVADEMLDLEGSSSEGSRHRYARAHKLLSDRVREAPDPVALAADVLRDHHGAPTSICCHGGSGSDAPSPTTASMIWEIEKGLMHVCAGPPCRNPYRVFSLD